MTPTLIVSAERAAENLLDLDVAIADALVRIDYADPLSVADLLRLSDEYRYTRALLQDYASGRAGCSA